MLSGFECLGPELEAARFLQRHLPFPQPLIPDPNPLFSASQKLPLIGKGSSGFLAKLSNQSPECG